MKPESALRVLYRERLYPPLWLLAFFFFLLGSLSLSIWAAFDNPAGWFSLVLSVVLVVWMRFRMALTIEITSQELRVGSAHIARSYLGASESLNAERMRLVRGREADPAAFLAIRFWQPRGVRIWLNDARDPTPYWLVSSKRNGELLKALHEQTAD